MTTNQMYWKRVGYVAIEDNDGNMVKYGGSHDGLDFKFSGVISGEICPSFSVSILGLSKETLVSLTSWSPSEAFSRMRRIQVYAGYEKDGLARPIFEGMVLEAIPTQPPEAWLNLSCMLHPMIKTPPVEFETEREEIVQIFDKIAEKSGYKSRWESTKIPKDFVVTYDFNKSPRDLATDFAHRFNLIVYNEDGVLIAKDLHGERGEPKDLKVIDINTGLLGLNNITLIGATIHKRLDTSIKCFSWVNLKSQIVPKANGSYYVISKKHVGHFRGREWNTELETHRKTIV